MEAFLMCNSLEEDDGISLIMQRKYAEARKYYEKKLLEVGVKFGEDHPKCVNVKEKLAFSMYVMGSFLEAKELFGDVVRKREVNLGDSHPHCIRIYMLMSVLFKKVGKKSEEDFLCEKLRKIQDKIDKNNDNFAVSCLQIAISYRNFFKRTEAERILRELLKKQGNSCWKNLPLSLLIKVEIGHTLAVTGKYSEAIACIEDILKSNSDSSEKEYPLYYICRMDIVLCYYQMDKFSEAKTQLEEILREQTERFGDNNVERKNILKFSAQSCFQQHNFEEAKSFFEEMLRKVIDIYGKESFFYFDTSLRICETIISLRNFSEAKSLLDELSRKIAHAFGKGCLLYVHVLTLKAKLNIEMGKSKEAVGILEELPLKLLDLVGKNHPEYINSKKILAEVYSASGKFAESLIILKDMLRIQSSIHGNDHLECLKTKIFIARTCNKLKKFVKSATLLKKVVKRLKEILGEDHKYTIDATGLLAVTFFHLGKKEEGHPLLDVFVRKMEFSTINSDLISDMYLSLLELKELEILKCVLEKSVEVATEMFGRCHKITISNQVEVAYCLGQLEKSAEAKEVIYDALAKLPKVCTQNDASGIEVKRRIAAVLIHLREHERAIILLKEVLKMYEKDEATDCRVLSDMILLASSLFRIGKYSGMKSVVQKGLILLSKVYWEEDPSYINDVVDFLPFTSRCGYHTTTINLCQKLLNLPHNIFGENHPKYLMVMELLGNQFVALGDISVAKRIYLELLKKTKEIHGENNEDFKRRRFLFFSCIIDE